MMKRIVRRLVATAGVFACLSATTAQAAIWEATEEWSEAHEIGYSKWIKQRFDKDFFHKPEEQMVFGLALDCSDAIYAMRIIYAYENGLPFAINDPTGKRRTISNEWTKWDGYREQRRHENDDGSWSTYQGPEYTEEDKVRAFIEYISDITYTLSLADDTYPVPLSDIRPGDMFLLPRNHAYIVKDVAPTGAMTTLSHSSPRAWRVMAQIEDFPAEIPEDKRRNDGYRRFKPIEHLKTPSAKVPGASEEQWEIAARLGGSREAFALATQDALASIKEPLDQKASRLFASLCDYAIQRVDIVNHGLNYLSRMNDNNGRRCMSIGEYAEYSTPGRDKKLEGQFRVLAALRSNPEWQNVNFAEKRVIEAIFAGENSMTEAEIGSFCAVPFDIYGGRNMTLRELYRGLEAGRIVSDPHAPLDHRWGLARDGWTPQCSSASRS
jgi:hypothetical protein